jgi:hypothetical protein
MRAALDRRRLERLATNGFRALTPIGKVAFGKI